MLIFVSFTYCAQRHSLELYRSSHPSSVGLGRCGGSVPQGFAFFAGLAVFFAAAAAAAAAVAWHARHHHQSSGSRPPTNSRARAHTCFEHFVHSHLVQVLKLAAASGGGRIWTPDASQAGLLYIKATNPPAVSSLVFHMFRLHAWQRMKCSPLRPSTPIGL